MVTQKQKKQEREKILTMAHNDHERKLNVHAFYKTSNRETGQDLVQETFRKTWEYLVKGGKIDLMKPFLYHVLNHLIIDEYRKRKHNTTSLDVLRKKGFEPSIDPSERIFNTFDGKGALLLIQHLPEKYKKVIRMRYVQGFTIKEISLITEQSRNTVAVQSHRGLAKLKKLYDRESEEKTVSEDA